MLYNALFLLKRCKNHPALEAFPPKTRVLRVGGDSSPKLYCNCLLCC